jgi:hypothetical protein
MKIGVLGTGEVGTTLAAGLRAQGHQVRIGSRSGRKVPEFAAKADVPEGTMEEVAAEAEVVVLAVQGAVAEGLLRQLAPSLHGKVVLDTTNPIAGPPVDGVLPYFTAGGPSLIERLQRAVPEARLVKWFNSVGNALMVQPAEKLGGQRPTLFLCGDDPAARRQAAALAQELGWTPQDVGSSANGTAVEGLCQIWCARGFLDGAWGHAFCWAGA